MSTVGGRNSVNTRIYYQLRTRDLDQRYGLTCMKIIVEYWAHLSTEYALALKHTIVHSTESEQDFNLIWESLILKIWVFPHKR